MKKLIVSALLSVASVAAAYDSHEIDKPRDAAEVERCETAREFVTTFEYLRDKKEYGLTEAQARDVATRVAAGCTGAAQRFVKTFELLLKSGAGPRSTIEVAIDLANKPQQYADTFLKIFSRAYLAEYLDLDYQTSFELAKQIATGYDGDPRAAADDFVKLVDFCISDKNVGLSKPQCGVIANRIVKRSGPFKVKIADEFIKVFNFLTSEKGPSAPVLKAVEVAENVVANGPEAADNFIASYEYAVSEKGLHMSAHQAIPFAQKLSEHTFEKSRLPAAESPPTASKTATEPTPN